MYVPLDMCPTWTRVGTSQKSEKHFSTVKKKSSAASVAMATFHGTHKLPITLPRNVLVSCASARSPNACFQPRSCPQMRRLADFPSLDDAQPDAEPHVDAAQLPDADVIMHPVVQPQPQPQPPLSFKTDDRNNLATMKEDDGDFEMSVEVDTNDTRADIKLGASNYCNDNGSQSIHSSHSSNSSKSKSSGSNSSNNKSSGSNSNNDDPIVLSSAMSRLAKIVAAFVPPPVIADWEVDVHRAPGYSVRGITLIF